MAVADRNGLPVSICVESATPHEVKLAVPTLVQMVIPEAPQNLIGNQQLRRRVPLLLANGQYYSAGNTT
jgi:hypothetical protein